jgi:hypothetical protein
MRIVTIYAQKSGTAGFKNLLASLCVDARWVAVIHQNASAARAETSSMPRSV